MGITHHGRSEAIIRALSDFGTEESFGQATKRFRAHYKYEVSPSTVYRETRHVAGEAADYVSNRLSSAKEESREISAAEVMLIESDGCRIRIAVSEIIENSEENTSAYGNPKKKIINWRDVRMGLARPSDSVAKVYVGKKDTYPDIVGDLHNAALLSGMSPETKVIGVADGGIGLREELENQFPDMRFISDKIHLKDHLYDTAEALGISKKERHGWVNSRLKAISR